MTSCRSIVLALALAGFEAPNALADEAFEYKVPAVIVGVDAPQLFDGVLLGQLGIPLPRHQQITGQGASAWAEVADNQFAARAVGGTQMAVAAAYQNFVVPFTSKYFTVRLNIGSKLGPGNPGFKGIATAGQPPNAATNNLSILRLRVFPAAPAYHVTLKDDSDEIVSVEHPYPLTPGSDLFVSYAQVQSWYKPEGGPQVCCDSHWSKYTLLNHDEVVDYAEGDGSTVTLEAFPSILVHPGVPYVIELVLQAGTRSLAVLDPLVEPHPDNSDVTVEFPDSAMDPNPPPIMGALTPDDLAAMDVDPQPFIDLGFFPPTASPVPTAVSTPTRPPTASAKCNPSGADATAIADARGRAQLACPCAGFDGAQGRKHGDYVRCVARTLKASVAQGLLKKSCAGRVKNCAAVSTCGKPAAVACYRTNARGKTTCAIKSKAASCQPPKGGTTCVGSEPSCCEACGDL
jgi:hypothetical protein